MKNRRQQIMDAYNRFVERKGFALLVTLCVAVITGTAVWTGNSQPTYVAPTPPYVEDQSASVLMQQSLTSASAATPIPSQPPLLWQSPLPELVLLRGYSETKLIRSGVTGIWELHEAIDLQAEHGDAVYAAAAGVVIGCGDNGFEGTWIEIRHADGYVSRYAGLAMLGAVKKGDQVRAGQTVGFVGSGMINESDLGPHLHLTLSKDGKPVDPLSVFE